jgi:hypothetical protein
MEGSGCIVTHSDTHELGSFEGETRVHIPFGWVDWEPDFSSQSLKVCANLWPIFRRKRFRCTFGWRLRMNLEWKPA